MFVYYVYDQNEIDTRHMEKQNKNTVAKYIHKRIKHEIFFTRLCVRAGANRFRLMMKLLCGNELRQE